MAIKKSKDNSKEKNKGGRPRKEIDKKMFESLCGMFCTLDDIADFFDCSQDTIERWCKRTYDEGFADTYKRKSSAGRRSLRRWQFEAASKGNTSMLIFLGKNYLGQADTMRMEANVADGKLADLIDGLKEPFNDDVHSEATGVDALVADEPTEAP